jgi:hypothetical protein
MDEVQIMAASSIVDGACEKQPVKNVESRIALRSGQQVRPSKPRKKHTSQAAQLPIQEGSRHGGAMLPSGL